MCPRTSASDRDGRHGQAPVSSLCAEIPKLLHVLIGGAAVLFAVMGSTVRRPYREV